MKEIVKNIAFRCFCACTKGITYDDFVDVEFVKNYDADTITFNIKGIPAVIGNKMPIRVYGIDTPEIKGKCEEEKALAEEAKEFVHSLLVNEPNIKLTKISRGKYFRLVAEVRFGENYERNLSQELLDNNYAVSYFGKTKMNWCDYLKNNRNRTNEQKGTSINS